MVITVTVTCKNKTEAIKTAKVLLKKKLIVCANYWPVDSIYRWQGKIEKSKEVMLICKSLAKNNLKIISVIEKIHSYKVPVITIEKIETNTKTLKWLKKEIEIFKK